MLKRIFIFIHIVLFSYCYGYLEKFYKKEAKIEKLNEKNENFLQKSYQRNLIKKILKYRLKNN